MEGESENIDDTEDKEPVDAAPELAISISNDMEFDIEPIDDINRNGQS